MIKLFLSKNLVKIMVVRRFLIIFSFLLLHFWYSPSWSMFSSSSFEHQVETSASRFFGGYTQPERREEIRRALRAIPVSELNDVVSNSLRFIGLLNRWADKLKTIQTVVQIPSEERESVLAMVFSSIQFNQISLENAQSLIANALACPRPSRSKVQEVTKIFLKEDRSVSGYHEIGKLWRGILQLGDALPEASSIAQCIQRSSSRKWSSRDQLGLISFLHKASPDHRPLIINQMCQAVPSESRYYSSFFGVFKTPEGMTIPLSPVLWEKALFFFPHLSSSEKRKELVEFLKQNGDRMLWPYVHPMIEVMKVSADPLPVLSWAVTLPEELLRGLDRFCIDFVGERLVQLDMAKVLASFSPVDRQEIVEQKRRGIIQEKESHFFESVGNVKAFFSLSLTERERFLSFRNLFLKDRGISDDFTLLSGWLKRMEASKKDDYWKALSILGSHEKFSDMYDAKKIINEILETPDPLPMTERFCQLLNLSSRTENWKVFRDLPWEEGEELLNDTLYVTRHLYNKDKQSTSFSWGTALKDFPYQDRRALCETIIVMSHLFSEISKDNVEKELTLSVLKIPRHLREPFMFSLKTLFPEGIPEGEQKKFIEYLKKKASHPESFQSLSPQEDLSCELRSLFCQSPLLSAQKTLRDVQEFENFVDNVWPNDRLFKDLKPPVFYDDYISPKDRMWMEMERNESRYSRGGHGYCSKCRYGEYCARAEYDDYGGHDSYDDYDDRRQGRFSLEMSGSGPKSTTKGAPSLTDYQRALIQTMDEEEEMRYVASFVGKGSQDFQQEYSEEDNWQEDTGKSWLNLSVLLRSLSPPTHDSIQRIVRLFLEKFPDSLDSNNLYYIVSALRMIPSASREGSTTSAIPLVTSKIWSTYNTEELLKIIVRFPVDVLKQGVFFSGSQMTVRDIEKILECICLIPEEEREPALLQARGFIRHLSNLRKFPWVVIQSLSKVEKEERDDYLSCAFPFLKIPANSSLKIDEYEARGIMEAFVSVAFRERKLVSDDVRTFVTHTKTRRFLDESIRKISHLSPLEKKDLFDHVLPFLFSKISHSVPKNALWEFLKFILEVEKEERERFIGWAVALLPPETDKSFPSDGYKGSSKAYYQELTKIAQFISTIKGEDQEETLGCVSQINFSPKKHEDIIRAIKIIQKTQQESRKDMTHLVSRLVPTEAGIEEVEKLFSLLLPLSPSDRTSCVECIEKLKDSYQKHLNLDAVLIDSFVQEDPHLRPQLTSLISQLLRKTSPVRSSYASYRNNVGPLVKKVREVAEEDRQEVIDLMCLVINSGFTFDDLENLVSKITGYCKPSDSSGRFSRGSRATPPLTSESRRSLIERATRILSPSMSYSDVSSILDHLRNAEDEDPDQTISLALELITPTMSVQDRLNLLGIIRQLKPEERRHHVTQVSGCMKQLSETITGPFNTTAELIDSFMKEIPGLRHQLAALIGQLLKEIPLDRETRFGNHSSNIGSLVRTVRQIPERDRQEVVDLMCLVVNSGFTLGDLENLVRKISDYCNPTNSSGRFSRGSRAALALTPESRRLIVERAQHLLSSLMSYRDISSILDHLRNSEDEQQDQTISLALQLITSTMSVHDRLEILTHIQRLESEDRRVYVAQVADRLSLDVIHHGMQERDRFQRIIELLITPNAPFSMRTLHVTGQEALISQQQDLVHGFWALKTSPESALLVERFLPKDNKSFPNQFSVVQRNLFLALFFEKDPALKFRLQKASDGLARLFDIREDFTISEDRLPSLRQIFGLVYNLINQDFTHQSFIHTYLSEKYLTDPQWLSRFCSLFMERFPRLMSHRTLGLILSEDEAQGGYLIQLLSSLMADTPIPLKFREHSFIKTLTKDYVSSFVSNNTPLIEALMMGMRGHNMRLLDPQESDRPACVDGIYTHFLMALREIRETKDVITPHLRSIEFLRCE